MERDYKALGARGKDRRTQVEFISVLVRGGKRLKWSGCIHRVSVWVILAY